MRSEDITVLILCYNEKENIARCIERLSWFGEILCIDSFSTDGTVEIIKDLSSKHPIRLVQNHFSTHSEQWNFGLSKVNTKFCLTLDSDYILSDQIIEEIKNLDPPNEINFWKASFIYMIDGKSIRKSLMPPRTILMRTDGAEFFQDGHTQRIKLSRAIDELQGEVYHDDRKPMERWKQSQNNYTHYEVLKLRATSWNQLSFTDRVRKTIFIAPVAVFFYCYFYNGMFLEGIKGLKYTYQRVYAELLLSKKLLLSFFK